jgi:hypothetical protein
MIEQVAVRTADMNRSLVEMTAMGYNAWVEDVVRAEHLYVHPMHRRQLGDDFTVRLAFNYRIVKGQEFELIQLLNGSTYQLTVCPALLSHFGYHVENQSMDSGDALEQELVRWQRDLNGHVVQISQTVHHDNSAVKNFYRYAFIVSTLGVPIKIIQRLRPSMPPTVAEGKDQYAWLLK